MLGALARSAGYFGLGMLLASLLSEVIGYLLPYLELPDGTQPRYVMYLEAVDTQWPVIVLLAIVFALVARASVEAQYGGGA